MIVQLGRQRQHAGTGDVENVLRLSIVWIVRDKMLGYSPALGGSMWADQQTVSRRRSSSYIRG